MNQTLHHDSFCRDVLSDMNTFLEFVGYLASKNADLQEIIALLDMNTLERLPGDFSDTENTGYADLAFRASVKPEYLNDSTPVQVCVGFLLEHKSYRDDAVLRQLYRYHYYLMVNKFKDYADKGIPCVAIILYNGKEDWNPLDATATYPKILQNILHPFMGIFVDVDDVDDNTCLEKFSPRLGAFMTALKYARNPEGHKETFKKALERLEKPSIENGYLALMKSMDVYLHHWLSANFKEIFSMDFIKAPYKTIADAEREERETLQKEVADEHAAREADTRRHVENALRKGLSPEFIADINEVTVEYVNKIKAGMK